MASFLKLLVTKHPIAIGAIAASTAVTGGIGYTYYTKPSGSDIIKRLDNIKELNESNVSTYHRSTNKNYSGDNNVNTGCVSYSCKNNPAIVPTSVRVTYNMAQVVNTFGLTDEEYSGAVTSYSIDSPSDLDTLIGCVIIYAKAGCELNHNKLKSK